MNIATVKHAFLGMLLVTATLSQAGITNQIKFDDAERLIFPSIVEMSVRKNSSRTTNRTIGELNLLAPFFQKQNSFYFMNYIGKRTNAGGAELNIGLGKRKLENNAISGLYGFLDVRKTPLRNEFWQLTLGQEHLSNKLDWRYNLYVPFSGSKDVPKSKRKPKVIESGNSLSIRSLHKEYAMHGIDFEVGHKKPYPWGSFGLWLGGYSFHNKHVSSINGPSVRIEAELTELKYLPEHVTLKWGMQFQRDNVRGENLTAQVALSVPLTGKGTRLSYMQRRMIEPVIRDVDIVSNTDSITEQAINMETGKKLNKIKRVRTGADLYRATKLGDANTLIVVENDITTSLEGKAQQDQVFISGDRKVLLTTPSGAVIAYQPSSGEPRAIRAITNSQVVVDGNEGVINKGVVVINKDSNGRNLVGNLAFSSRRQVTARRGSSFSALGDIGSGYTFRLRCRDDFADCAHIRINPNTGYITLGAGATKYVQQVRVIATRNGLDHEVELNIERPGAQQSANEQRDRYLPNQERLDNGITLRYGNDYRCAGDRDVYGGASCDTSGQTKINYVRRVINSLLSKRPEVARQIIAALKRNHPTMTLFNSVADKDEASDYLSTGGNNQDLQADEVFAGGAGNNNGLSSDDNQRNAALEEITHLIQNYGITDAFPEWQERLDRATANALRNGQLNWDSDELHRRDLDDEYFADAVEAYFNMRGGAGVTTTASLCSSGGVESSSGRCTAGNTARDDLRRNHRDMYNLVREIFGDGARLFD